MPRVALSLVVVLGLVLPALAQEPGGGEEKYDVEAALKEVSRLMGEAESLLVKALKPGGSAESAAKAGEKAREEIEKLLTGSRENGQKASEKMQEILENAPHQSGQGEGQEEQPPDSEEERKRREQEQKVDERDPRNTGEGDPKDGRRREERPENPDAKKPPRTDPDKAAEPDPNAEWLANLPEQVRQAYLNGEWEVIPLRWRKLIEEYTKRVASSDR
ncbi:MAG: hypothetical protein MUC63_00050 [Planctomycetes bacterium]|nr:hypothetical protein [Planctomycetota bacterium]MCU0725025.1 hypothetical protein [Planctomycetota bacterium]